MQCTPESNIYLESCKGQHCNGDCSDSGYSGVFHSPQSICGVDSCRSLSPVEFCETPKENIWLSVTPKERTREPVEYLGKDPWGVQRPPAVSWCETPKVYKRDAPMRQRLLMCKTATDVKTDHARSPCSRRTSISAGSEHWLSASFDSLDTLKLEQDLLLSGRKRRLLFTQETPQSPVSGVTNTRYDGSSVLSTPSSSRTPKYIRSLCEDSGFSSLTLDKSQDSSVDNDGSFLELLLSASKGNSETPNLAEARRRSRLLRQHRLSTLKEGGSQSEEDLAERKHGHLHQSHSLSTDDEVFAHRATPSAKCTNGMTSDSLAAARQDDATPLTATPARPESTTSLNATPLRTTPINLSLTPALQLIHAMCQLKAHMFVGQSPSLKEQLKSTVALVQTPVAFRTTMPLAGLIGRKMGLRKVDILTELKKRNLRHILSVILSHLTSESIYMCGEVCTSWKEILQQDKRASLKRRNYVSEVEAALKLAGDDNVNEAETRLALLKRSALKKVQAQSRTSSFCTPKSGNCTLTPSQHRTLSSGSRSKRDEFLEVAQTLFNDECLKPCPRCRHPARCHSVKQEGVCSRAECEFQFCTACMCAFHGSRECGSQSVGRRKKDTLLPGSAQSKRNVRRL
ncbi:F-box only protein 43 isoform X2 [Cyclopterus lumpus]|uniref:F-box only protein 43 isoform X2 n=1 Tax=Cyclopterus lumpus TaxID=8103 RepID=UPI001485DF33|nr:F-box only protein 43 isoform X2 [Cyclopterus lumpus]